MINPAERKWVANWSAKFKWHVASPKGMSSACNGRSMDMAPARFSSPTARFPNGDICKRCLDGIAKGKF